MDLFSQILYSITDYLPVKEPVLIFSIVLFIILFSPILLKRLRIPGIVGLILAGVMLGPNGFYILENDSSFKLFGTVGLLYIMFVAGLELDLNEFKKNQNKSYVFGSLTFFVPLIFGYVVSKFYFGFSEVSSVLLASMFSTHTLVAYPIASRLGITKNEAVTIAVGGTIITDTAVLLVLAVISGSQKGNFDIAFFLRLALSLSALVFVIFWGFPRITRWFFKNVQGEKTSQYIFILALVFMASFLAELAGVEKIIGAFLAGLALNRLIPHTSALMNRIEFVGNALFIPFFLIGVGMVVDLRVIFSGTDALIFSIVLTSVALISKWVAAWITQLIYKYSSLERKIIFGLSSAHAAAILAVVKVGVDLGLLDNNVLNGTIILILVTCLVSSFVVEKAGRKLAMTENEKLQDESDLPDRILIPVSTYESFEYLIDLANMVKSPKSLEPIYPLSIVKDDESIQQTMFASNKLIENVKKYSSQADKPVQVLTRVDVNENSAILRALKDLMITELIISWNEKTDLIFGNITENLVKRTERMIMLSKIIQSVNTTKKITVAIPENAEYEKGFNRWIGTLVNLSKQTGASFVFYCTEKTEEKIKELFLLKKISSAFRFVNFNDWDDILIISKDVQEYDLLVIVSTRINSVSYNPLLDLVPRKIAKHFAKNNFIIIYPEQNATSTNNEFNTEGLDISPIQENLERLTKIGKGIKNIFKNPAE